MATSYIFHGHESLHKYRQILNSHLGEDTPELIEPNKIMVFEGLLASVTRSIAFLEGGLSSPVGWSNMVKSHYFIDFNSAAYHCLAFFSDANRRPTLINGWNI